MRPNSTDEGLVQLAVGLSIVTNILVINAYDEFSHDGSPSIYGEVEASFAKEATEQKKPGCTLRVSKIEVPLKNEQEPVEHGDVDDDITELVQQWTMTRLSMAHYGLGRGHHSCHLLAK